YQERGAARERTRNENEPGAER
ncbi:hypothetical protein V3C99_006303, partial [Haemonchus contortus]